MPTLTVPNVARRLPSILETARLLGDEPTLAWQEAEDKLGEYFRNDLQTTVNQAFIPDAGEKALALLHAPRLLAAQMPSETLEQFRARLLATAADYRPIQGTTAGLLKILGDVGMLRPSWFYLMPDGQTTFSVVNVIHSVALVTEAADSATKFLLGTVEADCTAPTLYYVADGSWVTVAVSGDYPTGLGNTAAEWAAVTEDLWADRCPCRGIFFLAESSVEQQLHLPRFYARADLEVE